MIGVLVFKDVLHVQFEKNLRAQVTETHLVMLHLRGIGTVGAHYAGVWTPILTRPTLGTAVAAAGHRKRSLTKLTPGTAVLIEAFWHSLHLQASR